MSVVGYERSDHTALITLRRPGQLNAMNTELMIELADAWNRFDADDDAWVAILTGEGRAFCAGLDFKERSAQGVPELSLPHEWPVNPWWRYEIDKPTIAAVNGLALGGGFFMVTRCDLRVAADAAYFQVTEIQRGGIAGSPSYELLSTENLPYAITAELAAGRVLGAERACQVGFLNEIAPRESLLARAFEIADELSGYPPLAVHHHLRLIREMRRERMLLSRNIAQQVGEARALLNASDDMREAFQSLAEKREPAYFRR